MLRQLIKIFMLFHGLFHPNRFGWRVAFVRTQHELTLLDRFTFLKLKEHDDVKKTINHYPDGSR